MPAGYINAGDYSADDSGLNAAASAAGAQGKGLWVPPRAGSISAAATISIPRNVPVQCFDRISFGGSGSTPGIVIGAAGAGSTIDQVRVEGLKIKRSVSWPNDGTPGVRIINAVGCFFSITLSEGFDVGVELVGDGDECSGNIVMLTSLRSCRVGIKVRAANGGSTKSNLFLGGRQTMLNSGSGSAPRYHIQTEGGDNDDGNVFIAGNAELRSDETSGEVGVCYFKTGHNLVMGLRQESRLNTSGKDAMIADGANAEGNLVWFTWDDLFGSTNATSRNGAPANSNGVLDQRSHFDPTGVGGFEV